VLECPAYAGRVFKLECVGASYLIMAPFPASQRATAATATLPLADSVATDTPVSALASEAAPPTNALGTRGSVIYAEASIPSAAERAREVAAVARCCFEVLALCESAFTEPVPVQIGINSGPLVAGVVGGSRLFYRVFGDGINSESHPLPRARASTQPDKFGVL
jgi:class 3 adenylate cyclase